MDKSEKIKVLRDIIKIKSDNDNEIKVARYLNQLFRKYGIKSEILKFSDERANLIAELGLGNDPRILGFSGHMDTVAVSDSDEWKYDPFEAKIEGDKLYGRGAADMKTGLAAQAIALIELKEEGNLPAGKIRFLATYGEESGAPGAELLTKQGYSQDLSAMIISEPTSGNVRYAHSGFLNYRIKSFGLAAHSSNPNKGINAISNLIPFLNVEAHLFDNVPKDHLLGNVPHSITIIEGGEQINTIPNYAELKGNIRPTKSFSNDQVIEVLRKEVEKINRLPQHHLEFELINNFLPIETDPKCDFIQFVLKSSRLGFNNNQIKLEIMKGGTDGSLFVVENPNMPVAILGADKANVSHQKNEYTTLSSFDHLIQTLKIIGHNYFTELN